jgi:hypothetical protein
VVITVWRLVCIPVGVRPSMLFWFDVLKEKKQRENKRREKKRKERRERKRKLFTSG